MIKFEKIKEGTTLYDVHSHRLGNTRLRSLGVWTVLVLRVDAEGRRALVSWNGNPTEWWPERVLARLRATRPEMVENFMGQRSIKPRPRKIPVAKPE